MAGTGARPAKAAIRLAQRIVADVRLRDLKPGDRLPTEQDMLGTYGVGRGTLRECLRLLEVQGVLEIVRGPSGGPVVKAPDATSLETALTLLLQFQGAPFRTVAEARTGLEPMMARLAAERMTDDQLRELRSTLDEMARGIDDRIIFLETNKEFHDLIARGSGNAIFGFLIDAMLSILDGSSMGIHYPERQRLAVVKAHERIYAALAARDADEAAVAMAEHIDEYARYARRRYPEVLDQPIEWVGADSET